MSKFTVKEYALGVQHLFAMFGSTVLVPLITGFSPSMALFTAGLGTLVFHLCTKGIVPAFLGSSFAFIGAMCTIMNGDTANIPLVQGGIIFAGLVYVLIALIVKLIGVAPIKKLFPPVVTGPVIIIIGLSLTGVGVKDAFGFVNAPYDFNIQAIVNMCVALFTFSIMALGMNWKTGFIRIIPILVGIAAGYVLSVILHFSVGFNMDFSPIAKAPWINVPYQNGFGSLPSFDLRAIVMIAPIAIVTFMEHIGDITTNGAVVGKDFFKDPGLHRTLLGDGLATIVAGFFGGPANTTYSENTGVLATTRNYNPRVLELAAFLAILLGLLGKFGAVLLTIPGPVKGGVELMLFGMIASIGIRTIVEAKIDMTNSRNLSIMAGVLCAGLGIGSLGSIPVKVGMFSLDISALFVATVVGVVLNLVLPSGSTSDNN